MKQELNHVVLFLLVYKIRENACLSEKGDLRGPSYSSVFDQEHTG